MALFVIVGRKYDGTNLSVDIKIPLDTWLKLIEIAHAEGFSNSELQINIPSREELLRPEVPDGFKVGLISKSVALSFSNALSKKDSAIKWLSPIVKYFKKGKFYCALYGKHYANPFFDETFGLLQNDFPIPTKQTKDKAKLKKFKSRVVEMLKLKVKEYNSWPHKGILLVQVSVCCPKAYINKVDVDNFLKLLFDIFKGYVFKDDRQVFYTLIDKNIHPKNMIGFIVGVKKIGKNEVPDFWPTLASSNPTDFD